MVLPVRPGLPVLLETKDQTVSPALQGHPDPSGLLDYPETRDRRAKVEDPAVWELPDHQDQREPPAVWDSPASRVHLVPADLVEQMVLAACRGHQVRPEIMVHLDLWEQPVQPDRLERLEIRAVKDSLGHREVKGTQALQEHLELLVIQELLD